MNHTFNQRNAIGANRLALSLWLTGFAFLIELAGGFLTNSLALLSDAWHMFSHLFALAISYAAILVASRPATAKKTYGFHRMEIIAALTNGITLFVIALFLSIEAVKRLFAPTPIQTWAMFWVALFGLLVNLLTAVILSGSRNKSLNVRSAYLHMLYDTLSSCAVILAGIGILWTGWYPLDPIASLAVSGFILFSGYELLRESIDILLEATPKQLSLEEVRNSILQVTGVLSVHDLHLWTITSGIHSLSVHVLTENLLLDKTKPIMEKIQTMLAKQYQVEHATIQFECINCNAEHFHDRM